MPVVEIATFPASEAFIADPTLLNGPITNILAKADGFISAYVGLQVEDRKTAYLVVVWQSLEAHQKLIADPIYPELGAQLKPALAGAINIQHVEFAGDATVAFNAPVTEVAIAKLKEGKAKEDFVAFIPTIVETSKAVPGIHGPGAYGEVIEEQRSFYLVLGWESVEAHKAVVSSGGPGKEVVAKFLDLVDMTVVHVKFTKTA
ncbi:hypothetical protein NMY22_g19356 [Coprinellus aureogranulatus]|nr:hypothetical protein NMY22_g19356 [Coprinellus aureogranulatus]